jgi:hypothetical protein
LGLSIIGGAIVAGTGKTGLEQAIDAAEGGENCGCDVYKLDKEEVFDYIVVKLRRKMTTWWTNDTPENT